VHNIKVIFLLSANTRLKQKHINSINNYVTWWWLHQLYLSRYTGTTQVQDSLTDRDMCKSQIYNASQKTCHSSL